MPPLVDVANAAATILVVAAAAVRQQRTAGRRHRTTSADLARLERELQLLRDRFDRWSGLP